MKSGAGISDNDVYTNTVPTYTLLSAAFSDILHTVCSVVYSNSLE